METICYHLPIPKTEKRSFLPSYCAFIVKSTQVEILALREHYCSTDGAAKPPSVYQESPQNETWKGPHGSNNNPKANELNTTPTRPAEATAFLFGQREESSA